MNAKDKIKSTRYNTKLKLSENLYTKVLYFTTKIHNH